MPAILSGSMSEYDWNQFCDKAETFIRPLNKLRWIFVGGTVAIFISFIVVMIATITSFNDSFNAFESCSGFDDCTSSSSPNPAVLFSIPAALMVVMIGLSCYVSNATRQGFLKIKALCEEESRKHDKLSFHLRDDRIVMGGPSYYSGDGYHGGYRTYHNVYIEIVMAHMTVVQTTATPAYASAVVVADPEIGAGYPSSNVYASPSAPPQSAVASTSSQSIQNRLEQLDNAKHLLTTKEYDAKRAEIMADL